MEISQKIIISSFKKKYSLSDSWSLLRIQSMTSTLKQWWTSIKKNAKILIAFVKRNLFMILKKKKSFPLLWFILISQCLASST